MTQWELVRRDHVEQAIAEYDRLGQEDFLSTYGLGVAPESVLVFGDRSYDFKAVLGVAHRYATGSALSSAEFTGGRDGAATVLNHLGFDIPADGNERPGATTATEVGSEHAHATWALAARDALLDTARCYQAVITTKELAAYVQERSRITTTQPTHYWIGDVLGRVARDCDRRGEPILTSLCVDSTGSVGAGYAATVLDVRGKTPSDPDRHAAEERLACYRHFGASLPADGGMPALTPTLQARRDRAQSKAVANLVRPLCPIHHMEYPAGGVCEECE